MILVLSGQTVASYDGEDGEWTGELEVEVGEETAHINVRFVDHEGDPVELDEDFFLQVEVEDESVAEFEQDTPGEFGGHLHGEAEGDTEVTFQPDARSDQVRSRGLRDGAAARGSSRARLTGLTRLQ